MLHCEGELRLFGRRYVRYWGGESGSGGVGRPGKLGDLVGGTLRRELYIPPVGRRKGEFDRSREPTDFAQCVKVFQILLRRLLGVVFVLGDYRIVHRQGLPVDGEADALNRDTIPVSGKEGDTRMSLLDGLIQSNCHGELYDRFHRGQDTNFLCDVQ